MPDDEQLDLFTPPIRDVSHARNTDPDTSHTAARAIEQQEGRTSQLRPGTSKHEALSAIARSPCTAMEAGRRVGRPELHKRVSDLKNAELIEDVGRRRDPVTERDGIVWALTASGWAALGLLDSGQQVHLA